MSSSSTVSKKPINKKATTPVRGRPGLRYNSDGSVHRDFPRIARPTDPSSPPAPNAIQKSFDNQKGTQNEVDNPQQQWYASIKERIINQLLKDLPPGLPAKAKLRANWGISTLSDDDPDDNGGFGVCIIYVLQKSHPGFFAIKTKKLSDNFEQ
jgi:hypothetical protein